MKHINKWALVLSFFSFLLACEESKTYKYVELQATEGILGGVELKEKEPKEIIASHDTSAYLEAFRSFCISLKVNQDMKETYGEVHSAPIDFKLLNADGNDIAKTIVFGQKTDREKAIRSDVFELDNSLQASVDRAKEDEVDKFNQTAKVDSAKVKELTKQFRQKKDEFSNDNRIWYHPKTAPQYTNQNGLYCYFQTENGMPSNLRFRFQYYGDDWLFFSKVQFSIDGKAYDYVPSDTERDSGNGGHIWEWFDQPLLNADKEFIHALANAKSAKMKIVGKQYYDTKVISQEQIAGIKKTLDLYTAMGGQY